MPNKLEQPKSIVFQLGHARHTRRFEPHNTVSREYKLAFPACTYIFRWDSSALCWRFYLHNSSLPSFFDLGLLTFRKNGSETDNSRSDQHHSLTIAPRQQLRRRSKPSCSEKQQMERVLLDNHVYALSILLPAHSHIFHPHEHYGLFAPALSLSARPGRFVLCRTKHVPIQTYLAHNSESKTSRSGRIIYRTGAYKTTAQCGIFSTSRF